MTNVSCTQHFNGRIFYIYRSLSFDDITLKFTLFADDMVLMGKNRNGLQKISDLSNIYCNKRELEINTEKILTRKLCLYDTNDAPCSTCDRTVYILKAPFKQE